MSYIVLIFGVPLIAATVLLSPPGLGYVLYGVAMYSVAALVFLPFVGWPVLLIEGLFPTAKSRSTAVQRLWLGGAVLVSVTMNFLASMLDYPPSGRGFDPTGHDLIPYNPQAGLLLGGFTICMLIGTGIWGVFARVMARDTAIQGALVTGLVLFGIVASLGYALMPESATFSGNSSPVSHPQGPNRPLHVEDAGDSWEPADGYAWMSADQRDLRVQWQPGTPSRQRRGIIAGDHEGKWLPVAGYTWLNPNDPEDLRIRPVSGR